MDVTGVVGDSPTPAFVRLQGLGAGGVAVLAQRTRNNPTALTMYAQAEAGTLGPDTATSGAANTSGGAGAYVTFGTNNNLTDRVTVNVPTATTSDALRGRYRVLLRRTVPTPCRRSRSDTGSTPVVHRCPAASRRSSGTGRPGSSWISG